MPTKSEELEKLQAAFEKGAMGAMLKDNRYNDDNTTIFKILFAKVPEDIISNYFSF